MFTHFGPNSKFLFSKQTWDETWFRIRLYERLLWTELACITITGSVGQCEWYTYNGKLPESSPRNCRAPGHRRGASLQQDRRRCNPFGKAESGAPRTDGSVLLQGPTSAPLVLSTCQLSMSVLRGWSSKCITICQKKISKKNWDLMLDLLLACRLIYMNTGYQMREMIFLFPIFFPGKNGLALQFLAAWYFVTWTR